MHRELNEPQPRRAYIEPVNGVEQYQRPEYWDRPAYPPAGPDGQPQWADWQKGGPLPQPVVINNVDAGPRTNHLLHLTLTVLTLGFWGPVWLIIWLVRGCR